MLMYKTKNYGVVSCKEENRILAELERDLGRKKHKDELAGRDKNTKPNH